MAEKKFKGSPFGTQTARFDVSGVHPKNKTPGTFTEIAYDKRSIEELNRRMGPGSYHVDVGGFNQKSVDERSSGPGWARAYDVEKMAALPHLLHKDQWELKKLLDRKLGPGSYEIKDFLEVGDLKPCSGRGICRTRATRFKDQLSETPGPGTYGKGGIPNTALEEKEQQSTSTIGMLDAGSSTPRNLPSVGSKLGPGTYNFKSFAEETVNKVTSTRGPYDLFSGDRNKPIVVGYLAAPKLANLGPGQYNLKSFVDDWDTTQRTRQGKFGKVTQYPEQPTERIFCSTLSQCPKETAEVYMIFTDLRKVMFTDAECGGEHHFSRVHPGPGQYDPGELSKPESRKAPGFLSTSQRNDKISQRFFTRNFNPVGPGRYDVQKWEEAQHQNGHNSVFRAKTGKLSASMEKFMRERIRAKDVRMEDRVFIVTPQAPPGYDLYRSTTQAELPKDTKYRSNTQADFTAQRGMTVA